MTKGKNRRGADRDSAPGARIAPRTSVIFSVLSADADALISARVAAEQLPAGAEAVLVGPEDLLRGQGWPPRVRVIELPGAVDRVEQRRRGAAAATGDLIRFVDLGGGERSVHPGPADLRWADRLLARKVWPP